MKYLVWVIAPCLFIFGAFSMFQGHSDTDANHSGNDSVPTRRQLRRSVFEKREILVVYGTEDKALSEKYRTLLDSLARIPQGDTWRSMSVRFKEASELSEAELGEHILFLVGTTAGNPVLKQLMAHTPFELTPDRLAFRGKEYRSDDGVLSISMYPNAQNDTLPVSFLTGQNEPRILAFFEKKVKQWGHSFFRQNMDYELYDSATRIVLGNFDPEWQPDMDTFFDFSSGTEIVHRSPHYDFIDHQKGISTADMGRLAVDIEKRTQDIIDFLGGHDDLPKMTYHTYKNAEEKGLITGNTDQAHFNLHDLSVHTVINAVYRNNFIEKENALLVHQLLGPSRIEALNRGLPVYFTDQWQREGYSYWSARLHRSGNALRLSELLDQETVAIESPLLVDGLSASLVDFLVKTWGRDKLLNNYSDWIPSRKEIESLEPLWQAYLDQLVAQTDFQPREPADQPYLKGFNFAHEGYGIYNGYVSRKASESISKQHEMGSNALALVPYSYMGDIHRPNPFRFSHEANDENDEGLVHSAHEAKKRGMFTVLKPQVWVGSSWPGAVEMLNAEDWKRFFDYYYRWIRHYALLAEIHGMDALCIGTEFTKATLGHGAEWREMIRKTRGLFQGKITYASNWGTEFETLDFWDELDFIGLNCYYPLSKDDSPTDKALEQSFEQIKTKIRAVQNTYKKPVVFTEIGFRSIDMPWKNPHAEGDDSINEVHQQRCYEVVFRGLENEPWCQGLLWWKFPSYLSYRGSENSSFTPNNKLAEETVRKWFSKRSYPSSD